MNLLTISSDILYIFLFSLAFLFIARKITKRIGLVDKPNYRKHHQGFIPLVGGISIYASLCFTFFIIKQPISHSTLYLSCAGILVFVGALDDRFDISVKIRALVQAVVGIIMMVFSGLCLQSFGHVLGGKEIQLGSLGYLVTLFAVWATINAFNMIDGIDGLLGCLSCISFGTLGILLNLSDHDELAFWCFSIIAATVPCILLNLGIMGLRYKVFMGDAGSTLIGFTNIWLLVQSSQGDTPSINPVTALWIIAIPLMDMVTIMYHRLRKGRSPFSPDRQHIHYLIMRSGFTQRQAFILITAVAIFLAGIGVIGERWNVIPEWIMLALFFVVFFLYNYLVKHCRYIACYIKRVNRYLRNVSNNKHFY
ncbi:UDP-N-acetylglucosamine--undecaprenyl-phosphate N-acetylglucosaminephosphotransferase [Candidatus Gillettellia adelgis]